MSQAHHIENPKKTEKTRAIMIWYCFDYNAYICNRSK